MTGFQGFGDVDHRVGGKGGVGGGRGGVYLARMGAQKSAIGLEFLSSFSHK